MSNTKKVNNDELVVMPANDPLFQYIKPRNNDMFSLMNGSELQELLYYVENYYLELRNRLGFDKYVTFGLELEFEKATQKRIEKRLREVSLYNSWKVKDDGSLPIGGAEISSPILTDNSNNWHNLKRVCSIVNRSAIIDEHSGGHIHIGTQVLGNNTESWLNFIKIWSVYENIIYRFSFGEFLTARPKMLKYAEPITKEFWEDYQKLKGSSSLVLKDIIEEISHHRNQAVNFYNVNNFNRIANDNTIEFRCPNGTLNPIIWQNNVNMFVNLLLYSKSSRYNDDIVENRKKENNDRFSTLDLYDEIYLQQALEFCDMVFTNNFDKVYFLRQYLKSFEIGSKKLSKAKEFTKKMSA